MPEHPPDPPSGPEAPRSITDQQMIFRSAEDSLTKSPSRKMKLKTTKVRVKGRKSTPAPPAKGNGRKRFVLSPLPEDKQLRKKLSFGEADSPGSDSSKCKVALTLAFSKFGESKGSSLDVIAIPAEFVTEKPASDVQDGPCETAPAPDSDQVPDGDVKPVGQGEDHPPHPSQADKAAPCDAHMPLGGEKVKLPIMEKETNSLLESSLVPYQPKNPRESPTVAHTMQPKCDNILHLASLNEAETMDFTMAQPLLAGNQPEVVHLAAKSPLLLTSPIEPAPDVMMLPYSPPLDDFPPLERGRTRKIRDNYEAGDTRVGAARTWPRAKADNLETRNTTLGNMASTETSEPVSMVKEVNTIKGSIV